MAKEGPPTVILPCLKRSSRTTQQLSNWSPPFLWRWGLKNPYGWEQLSFWLRLWPHLRRGKYDILHVQDPMLAYWCRLFRKWGLVKTREILAHGTEEPVGFVERFEYVQHLAPWHLEQTADYGLRTTDYNQESGVRSQEAGAGGQEAGAGRRASGVGRQNKKHWVAIPNFVDCEVFCPAGGASGKTGLLSCQVAQLSGKTELLSCQVAPLLSEEGPKSGKTGLLSCQVAPLLSEEGPKSGKTGLLSCQVAPLLSEEGPKDSLPSTTQQPNNVTTARVSPATQQPNNLTTARVSPTTQQPNNLTTACLPPATQQPNNLTTARVSPATQQPNNLTTGSSSGTVQQFSRERDHLRRQIGIPSDAFVIGCVAAVKKHHKRVDWLIREVGLLVNRYSLLVIGKNTEGLTQVVSSTNNEEPITKNSAAGAPFLLIAGAKTDESSELIQLAESLLPGRFKILLDYPRDRMPDLYRAMDAFVLPSLFEMMPIAVLEALASGVPCLVNRHPVLEWMVGAGGGGGNSSYSLLVIGNTKNQQPITNNSRPEAGGTSIDMSREGELARALAGLTPEWLAECGRNARARALSMFSKEAVVRQYVAYYEAVKLR